LPVDSFKFLPRLIATFYQMADLQRQDPIPWTPLPRPLSECTFGLVTSAGLYLRGSQPPFDVERERREPTWGDPTYRAIPTDIAPSQVGVSHLHINPQAVLEDINVLLPVDRFRELAPEGVIGGLADVAYSFMGYQGFPPDPSTWEETCAPEVASQLKAQDVDCVFLTPA
jgi:D-proline reductase (dithiol) PrdB